MLIESREQVDLHGLEQSEGFKKLKSNQQELIKAVKEALCNNVEVFEHLLEQKVSFWQTQSMRSIRKPVRQLKKKAKKSRKL
jgi:hypothetical protein